MNEGPAASAAEESTPMSEPQGSGNQTSNEAVPEVTIGAHNYNPDANALC